LRGWWPSSRSHGVAPVALLAVLRHPLFRLGGPAGTHLRAVAALERAILRGPRPRAGSAGLAHALETFRRELASLRAGERSEIHRNEPRATLSDAEVDAAIVLVERLTTAMAPLERMAAKDAPAFSALAAAASRRHCDAEP